MKKEKKIEVPIAPLNLIKEVKEEIPLAKCMHTPKRMFNKLRLKFWHWRLLRKIKKKLEGKS